MCVLFTLSIRLNSEAFLYRWSFQFSFRLHRILALHSSFGEHIWGVARKDRARANLAVLLRSHFFSRPVKLQKPFSRRSEFQNVERQTLECTNILLYRRVVDKPRYYYGVKRRQALSPTDRRQPTSRRDFSAGFALWRASASWTVKPSGGALRANGSSAFADFYCKHR